MSFEDPQRAGAAADTRQPCPWCGKQIRPCNLARHVAREHHRQTTIDEALEPPPGDEPAT